MILRIDYEESEHADTFGFVSVRVVGGVHVGLLKKKNVERQVKRATLERQMFINGFSFHPEAA